jgi:hypothetical protein
VGDQLLLDEMAGSLLQFHQLGGQFEFQSPSSWVAAAAGIPFGESARGRDRFGNLLINTVRL